MKKILILALALTSLVSFAKVDVKKPIYTKKGSKKAFIKFEVTKSLEKVSKLEGKRYKNPSLIPADLDRVSRRRLIRLRKRFESILPQSIESLAKRRIKKRYYRGSSIIQENLGELAKLKYPRRR